MEDENYGELRHSTPEFRKSPILLESVERMRQPTDIPTTADTSKECCLLDAEVKISADDTSKECCLLEPGKHDKPIFDAGDVAISSFKQIPGIALFFSFFGDLEKERRWSNQMHSFYVCIKGWTDELIQNDPEK